MVMIDDMGVLISITNHKIFLLRYFWDGIQFDDDNDYVTCVPRVVFQELAAVTISCGTTK